MTPKSVTVVPGVAGPHPVTNNRHQDLMNIERDSEMTPSCRMKGQTEVLRGLY